MDETINWLIGQLEDFQDLTVARMAIKDLRNGNLNSAMQRLKVDADKMRDPEHPELYRLIVTYGSI